MVSRGISDFSTLSTRAPLGPVRSPSSSLDNTSTDPRATTSTRPSARFVTHP